MSEDCTCVSEIANTGSPLRDACGDCPLHSKLYLERLAMEERLGEADRRICDLLAQYAHEQKSADRYHARWMQAETRRGALYKVLGDAIDHLLGYIDRTKLPVRDLEMLDAVVTRANVILGRGDHV
jgi:hypothetical protein